MANRPDIRFAEAAGSSIAYHVFGAGPPTICVVPPMAQNIEMMWESPTVRAMLERYAGFSRQIMFDKRGTGLSDRSLDIPGLDERVDELRAVLDGAGVARAFVHGISEGGPMAIMFAATYPERVDGLILEGTAASLITDEHRRRLATPAGLADALAAWQEFVSRWGTAESQTVARFGPSLLADEQFCAWWPRYERNAASRDALLQLFQMNSEMDARGVVDRVECPVLILHRTGDQVIAVDRARETAELFGAAGVEVELCEVPGRDHWAFAGDPDPICDAVERFTTGTVSAKPARPPRIQIRAMGRFEVRRDGVPVPAAQWRSRRARTLLKRLVVARGWPVTRDELIDLLWPEEHSDRLNARLSVQLSAVRRVLAGGVIADRSTVRLDLAAVEVDVEQWFRCTADPDITDGYAELLPEDSYDDWSRPLRDEMRDRFVAAVHRIAAAGRGESAYPVEDVVGLLRRVVDADPYDEAAHRRLIDCLRTAGRTGEAATAERRYRDAMRELGL